MVMMTTTMTTTTTTHAQALVHRHDPPLPTPNANNRRAQKIPHKQESQGMDEPHPSTRPSMLKIQHQRRIPLLLVPSADGNAFLCPSSFLPSFACFLPTQRMQTALGRSQKAVGDQKKTGRPDESWAVLTLFGLIAAG